MIRSTSGSGSSTQSASASTAIAMYTRAIPTYAGLRVSRYGPSVAIAVVGRHGLAAVAFRWKAGPLEREQQREPGEQQRPSEHPAQRPRKGSLRQQRLH